MPQQYQVPQFVDVEDKILGPLTAKQFLMYVVALLIIGALWTTPLPREVVIILAIPILVLTSLLAFYKVNGRTFVWFLYAVAHFFVTGKMFLWDRRGDAVRIRVGGVSIVEQTKRTRGLPTTAVVNESRIQALARILDTTGKVVEEDAPAPAGFEKE